MIFSRKVKVIIKLYNRLIALIYKSILNIIKSFSYFQLFLIPTELFHLCGDFQSNLKIFIRNLSSFFLLENVDIITINSIFVRNCILNIYNLFY